MTTAALGAGGIVLATIAPACSRDTRRPSRSAITVGAKREARYAYVGTYTKDPPGGGGASTPVGISVFRVSPGSGTLSLIQTVPSANPSWLVLDATQRFLYAANEIDDYGGQQTGSAEAYAIDAVTGMLTLLNRQPVGGSVPAHLAVDPTGRFLVVGNYVAGNFTILPLDPDGRLRSVRGKIQHTGKGPNVARQEAPHPHAVVFDPAGRYLVTADLGIDTVQVFRLDTAAATLVLVSAVALIPGTGPRHVAFSPNARFLYVISELSATVTTFLYDAASGVLGPAVQTISTVPADFAGTKSAAEVAVHPSGQFLYGSNRGQPDATSQLANAIVSFAIDQTTGTLTLIDHTTAGIEYPRSFAIDPTGTWLYVCNQQGDTIVQFRIDLATGQLSATGQVTRTPTPVCLVFKNVVA